MFIWEQDGDDGHTENRSYGNSTLLLADIHSPSCRKQVAFPNPFFKKCITEGLERIEPTLRLCE